VGLFLAKEHFESRLSQRVTSGSLLGKLVRDIVAAGR